MRALLFAALLAAGCSSKKATKVDPGPTCAQVVDNLVKIFGETIAGHENMQLIDRNQEIARCEQRKPSLAERTCLQQAKNKTDLANCRKFRRRDREEQPPPPRDLPPAGSGAGTAPAVGSAGAPAPTGSAGAPAPTGSDGSAGSGGG